MFFVSSVVSFFNMNANMIPKFVKTNSLKPKQVWIPKGPNIFVYRFIWKPPRKNKWYLDSGWSRYMMGNQSKFVSIYKKDGGLITFGDNKKGKIIGKGTIGNDSGTFIENVLFLVDFFFRNLLGFWW